MMKQTYLQLFIESKSYLKFSVVIGYVCTIPFRSILFFPFFGINVQYWLVFFSFCVFFWPLPGSIQCFSWKNERKRNFNVNKFSSNSKNGNGMCIDYMHKRNKIHENFGFICVCVCVCVFFYWNSSTHICWAEYQSQKQVLLRCNDTTNIENCKRQIFEHASFSNGFPFIYTICMCLCGECFACVNPARGFIQDV